jgi:hypothetical protein
VKVSLNNELKVSKLPRYPGVAASRSNLLDFSGDCSRALHWTIDKYDAA